MNYTIVWNEAGNEGIILSDDNFSTDVDFAKANIEVGFSSSLVREFRSIYGAHEPCTSVSLSKPSEDMVKAGVEAYLKDEGKDVAEVIESIYKAMIEKLTCNP